MTSVPSRLRLLSGNNISIFILTYLLSSCTPKLVPSNTPTQEGNTSVSYPPPPKTTPPSAGSNTKTTAKTNTSASTIPSVDTVRWVVDASTPPIISREKKKVVYTDKMDIKEEYNIKLLIPFNANGISSSEMSSSKFVQFYAGVLKAMEVLDDEAIKLNIQVIDADDKSAKIKDKLTSIVNEGTDLVIGPFERDDIKVYAEACKVSAIPLVSPWQTSSKITVENPYYIQMKPNLREHFARISQSVTSEYKKGEVAIIGKNIKETNSWISFFQQSAKEQSGVTDFFAKHYVTQDSITQGKNSFGPLFRSNVKAVVIPNYSYTDEDFIYQCLRRLLAEKGGKSIVVYGMPILYESEKVDFDFYHALNMRIAMSDFVDADQARIQEFRRAFLDQYGEIPTDDAIKGYDLMLYIGRNLWKYGKNFQYQLENEATSYLLSTYNITKAKSEDSPVKDDPNKFDYFENKHLDIVEFKGNKFKVRN
jgi:ABC-type branched-subunit amino acid transport system substrate-binding protein